jgi:ribosomal protein S18 acetylase RimI-like enzyme
MNSATTATVPTIRSATPGDYRAASDLYQTTLSEGFVLDPELWEAVCTTVDTYRTLIAEDARGNVAGLAVVVVSDRIRLAAGTRRRRFHVDDLIVSPKNRRQGIGRALLEHVKVLARAEAPSYVLINCDFMNVAARKTYESAGLHLMREGGDRFEIAFRTSDAAAV